MIKNYLKIALRNAVREWNYTSLNIFGLAFGIAITLIILQFVSFEYSYEKSYKDRDNLYFLTMKWDWGDRVTNLSMVNAPMAPLFKKSLEEVENYCRVGPVGLPNDEDLGEYFLKEAGSDKFIKQNNIYSSDSTILSILDMKIVEGRKSEMLKSPFSAIISKSTKDKIFGKESAYGKTIIINHPLQDAEPVLNREYTITGVYEDLPDNSVFDAEILISMTTVAKRANLYTSGKMQDMGNWWASPRYTTLLKLSEGTNLKNLISKMRGLMTEPLKIIEEQWNLTEIPELVKLENYHFQNFGGAQNNEMVKISGNKDALNMMILLSILIMAISFINYINLTSARSVRRAKEVGLRKVNGSSKSELIKQFYLEALIINTISLFFGLIIAQIGYSFVANLLESPSSFVFLTNSYFWVSVLGFLLVSSFITGIYPALVMTSYNVGSIVNGTFSRSKKGNRIRKYLVFTQFLLGTIFIFSIYIIYKQYNYILKFDRGVNVESAITVSIEQLKNEEANNFHTHLNRFEKIKGVEKAAISYTYPGDINTFTTHTVKVDKSSQENFHINLNFVTSEYFNIFNHKILAGKSFSETESAEWDAVITENTLTELGLENPLDAIGKTIYFPVYDVEFTVIGVLENYTHYSAKYKGNPHFFKEIKTDGKYFPPNFIDLKLSGNWSNYRDIISEVEEELAQIHPELAFDYSFIEDEYAQLFKNEEKFIKIFSIFSVLAIVISCLGLFGLSSYNTLNRTKEIGIRKVLGSSIQQIIWYFSKDYLKIIAISGTLGICIGGYLMNQWLMNYESRISIGVDSVILPFILVLIITFVTVGFQIYKTSIENPVKALRND